jgi:hypothetical protein
MLPTTINALADLPGNELGVLSTPVSFEQVEPKANSTLYADASREANVPRTLFVSHERSKNGNRQNSVIILKDTYEDEDGVAGTAIAQLKLSYDKLIVPKATVKAALDTLIATFISDDTSNLVFSGDHSTGQIDMDRFLNEEH